MPSQFPGAYNTFIPNAEASGKLVVDFVRNTDKFSLPKYVQYIDSEKILGKYIEMDVENAARVAVSDDADAAWPDNTDAPQGTGNTEAFEFKSFQMRRWVEPVNLGELTVDQAEWDILAQHSRHAAQRTMTRRTRRVTTLLEATANWPTGHTSAVTSITGVTGKHNLSTTARMDIKRSLDYAAEQIRLATLGSVTEGFIFLISPTYAREISVAQEIVDFIKGSPAAKEYIGNKLGPNAQYGLPQHLYGCEIVVEDAVKVTSRKGASTAVKSYVKDSDKPVLLSRPDGLDGIEGSPSFSTVTIFQKEIMNVETKHDRDNRRHRARVVENYAEVLTAPISGFLFTDALQ